MRVLVCGGRDFVDQSFLNSILDTYHEKFQFSLVIQGGARGADRFARTWAIHNNIDYEEFKPDWESLGRAAGPIRNTLMLENGKPDLVIAFPGHTGTQNMIMQAQRAKTPVLEILFPQDRS